MDPGGPVCRWEIEGSSLIGDVITRVLVDCRQIPLERVEEYAVVIPR